MSELNKEQNVNGLKKLKWAIIILGIPMVFLWLILGVVFGFGMLLGFLSFSGAPTTTGFDILKSAFALILVFILYALPIVVIIWLYLRRRYWLDLTIIIFILGGVLFYTGSSVLEPLLGRIGINLPSALSAPKNILIISDKSLPDDYFHYERGSEFGDIYIARYFSRSKKDAEINFSYTKNKSCQKSDAGIYSLVSCVPDGMAHECYVETLTPQSKVRNYKKEEVSLGFYRVTYLIDDFKSCAKIEFRAKDENEGLSADQMLQIINSLRRVK